MAGLKVCLLVCLIQVTFARIGFVKDQSIDKVEFPPRTLQTFHSGVPTGHLRPLGKFSSFLYFLHIL